MNENLIDKVNSDSNFGVQYCSTNKQETNQVFPDNDSDSSIFNLLDRELSNKTPDDNFSPYYSMAESSNHHETICHSKQLAIPDIKSETTDQRFEDLLRSKLPQIIAVEKASIQYQVHDQNYPCLSKSFKNCYNSPVLDLLVVVLNTEKLVTFYQGYFAGIPRLANELIDLNSKYWKSLISNNDENAWENHYKSVTDKFNSLETNELEFEVGPVIRCRLKASNKQQFNQQFNYFFVQPCSYMVQLSQSSHSCHVFNLNDPNFSTDNVYMVSYINIMRECDTEYALKGSAAASLQKVITNSTNIHRPKSDSLSESSATNKPASNRPRKTATTANNNNNNNNNHHQLSINISSPTYTNSDKQILSAPLTYPLINDQHYPKQRASQVQQHVSQQRQSMPMINNQYMTRGVAINIIDPNTHHYQTHYQVPSSTSTLQYMLENRNTHYPNSKPIQHNTAPHHMVPQHSPAYQNTGRPNVPCFLPTDHNQSSLNSPTTFMPTRHIVPMSSNGILLSTEQYFRNNHQINVIDSVQVAQPMMTVVRSMPSTLNHGTNSYYCSTAQSQQPQTPIHVNNSLPHQGQFSASSLAPYCNNKSDLIHLNSQPYHVNRMGNSMSIKQECDDMALAQKDWHTNQIMDESSATTYCGSINTLPMTNDSISFDIVEEILKAEEAKSENKHSLNTMALSISDNSDQLSFDLDDFMLLDQSNRPVVSNTAAIKLTSNTPSFTTKHNEQILNREYSKQSSNSSDSLFSLKSETLETLTSAQKIGIKNIVNQHKEGKLTKKQMLHQIDDFVSRTFGESNHRRRIMEYWKNQHPNADSTLSNLNCSHVVQSPEEGPGISPTEQAAQSTTDMEDDKDLNKQVSRLTTMKCKDESSSTLTQRRCRTKSSTKSLDASIYSITSTTSTCVLETLLNEHDNNINSDKPYLNNFNSKLSVSSTPKNQLSLDQLLMDDDGSMFAGFNPNSHEDKVCRRSSENSMRQLSSNIKSQPSTPLNNAGNMGVLESLLNQKNPSMYGIRQKSTENILKHSKPSRQNSIDTFHDETGNEKDNGIKKNSLLITLLNNSSGNTSVDKYNMVNSSTPCPADVSYSVSQPKRQRMYSGANLFSNENTCKKTNDKLCNGGMDVFDFEDGELNFSSTEFQSGTVTSSQSMHLQKTQSQGKRSRKRCYSKEMSIDSDGSSDKAPSKSTMATSQSNEKKVILTSLLETRKIEDSILPTVATDRQSDNFVHPGNRSVVPYDDNLDLEDIKIDDFDLEHMIDMSEPLNDPSTNDNRQSAHMIQDSVMYSDSAYSASSYEINNTPIYTMVTPVISISQSDPIVPVSKQSIIRLSDKNSILFSAIQSTSSQSSMGTITVECLDNERERLLKQQQQQKVYMSGKYLSLNTLGVADPDCQPNKMSHPQYLDLLSKRMKEVGPNVMVEQSNNNNIESMRPRKSSFSRIAPVISPLNSAQMPSSPIGRLSSSADNQGDSNKLSTTSFSNVNHQQVREGLRLLVSNRSAQNNSKNNNHNQRHNATSLNELMASPNAEYNVARTSVSKSMIHYHSTDTTVAPIPKNEPSPVSHSLQNQNPPVCLNESKATNILEDSLVNDVFELEELVNSKTSKPILEIMGYQSVNVPRTLSDVSLANSSGGDTTMVPLMSDLNNSTHMIAALQASGRQPHHHHHLQHYHHHHLQHHHHHTQANMEPTTHLTKDKQTANSTSGLLETLLSK